MMKKLFLIVLLLPLLFAVETEKWSMPLTVPETPGDSTWACWLVGEFTEIDTLIILKGFMGEDGTIQSYGFSSEALYDTSYAPQIIIEYEGQKFKIVLSPIIESK